MRNVILHILCEGQTEERFITVVLSPYLRQFGIYSKPVLLLTSRKKNVRGGMLSYVQSKRDLLLLRKQFRDNDFEHHIFTTMFDFYALPNDFPGFSTSATLSDVRERIRFIEDEFGKDINEASFIPYIQLHEFETLLFVDIVKLVTLYPLSAKGIQALKQETASYCDPEMVNDGPATAPSKRIIKAVGAAYHYNKVQTGAAVTSLIGIDRLLTTCRHFGEWIEAIRGVV